MLREPSEGKNSKQFSIHEIRAMCENYDYYNGFQNGKLPGREIYECFLESLGIKDEGNWVYDE